MQFRWDIIKVGTESMIWDFLCCACYACYILKAVSAQGKLVDSIHWMAFKTL